jgi:hypothetical protein
LAIDTESPKKYSMTDNKYQQESHAKSVNPTHNVQNRENSLDQKISASGTEYQDVKGVKIENIDQSSKDLTSNKKMEISIRFGQMFVKHMVQVIDDFKELLQTEFDNIY